MRKFLVIFAALFALVSCDTVVTRPVTPPVSDSVPAIVTEQSDRYNISSVEDLAKVKREAMALKALTKSETLKYEKSNRHEFLGINRLRDRLGDDEKEFKTQYLYITDAGITRADSTANWYFFTNKKRQVDIYALYYKTNDVTRAMNEGDLFVMMKIDSDNLIIALIDHKSKQRDRFIDSIGLGEGTTVALVEPTAIPAEVKSTKTKQQQPAAQKIASAPSVDENFGFDYESYETRSYRDKDTNKIYVIGNVERVVDGDTFYMGGLFNVRMVGIDTPESWQPCKDKKGVEYKCGTAASAHLKKILGRSRLKCESHGTDRNGRFLFTCENSSGKDINAAMVESGYAVVSNYPPILYDKEEARAREKKIGLWAGEFQHPHCFRHRKHQDWERLLCDRPDFWNAYPALKAGKTNKAKRPK